MAAEYAPDAIQWLGAQIVAGLGGEVSGIIGDPSHTYGYHRCRNVLPADDYSVQLAADQLGDGWAVSALDVTLPTALMPVVTKRLLDSAKDRHDPRLDPVREFYGTLDGVTVTGWDCVAYAPATSDRSHVWHIHVSILRQYANDMAAMGQILSVILGGDDLDPAHAKMLEDVHYTLTHLAPSSQELALHAAYPDLVADVKAARAAAESNKTQATAQLSDQQLNTLADLVTAKLASQVWHVSKG